MLGAGLQAQNRECFLASQTRKEEQFITLIVFSVKKAKLEEADIATVVTMSCEYD
jgi:hypothetical protein